MSVQEIMSRLPFVERLGIDVTEAADGHAVGELELREDHSSNPDRLIAHGGVTYSLADTVGGAAVISLTETVTPTIDMRMDYLAPATSDLRAVAEVIRVGGSVAVVDVDVYDASDRHVATARGTYKTGGQGEDSPWSRTVSAEEPSDGSE